MKNETRTAVYDQDLRLEACRLRSVVRPFPSHFHENYVIGLVEEGRRTLTCRGREYVIGPGCVLLFGPGDSHACVQCDGGVLDYRSLSISRAVMEDWAGELGRAVLSFPVNVIRDDGLAQSLRTLHQLVMNGAGSFEKEEALLLLLSELARQCGLFPDRPPADCRREVEQACAFMEARYAERISLEQLCRCTGLSRSALLRAFAGARGVTPYRYLESVRIERAKELLAQGVSLPDAALRAGFSDQSHFTNYFTSFTGLSPGAYRDMFRSGSGGKAHEED